MVAREGLGSMRGLFQSAGKFDQCLRDAGMECTHIGDGEVECVLTVPESLSNTYGTMHGGAVSTVIDVLGTMALLTKDHTRAVRPTHPGNQVATGASEGCCWLQGVSVDMNMTFCSAARTGEELLCAPYLPPSPSHPHWLRLTVSSACSLRGRVLRSGRTMGYTEIEVMRKSDGAMLAVGRHTKAFPAYSASPE